MSDSIGKSKANELEAIISELKLKLEDTELSLEAEKEKRQYYELISEFTFGWEIWLNPEGEMKYSSPSCCDLTGFTANQFIQAEDFVDLIVYETDKKELRQFISGSLGQLIMNKPHEFRILTRHKQLQWCSINARGVYNKQGRYLGIRASIQNITHLKNALGQIHTLTTGKEIENRAKMRFKSELELKERELVSFLLQLSQKNEYINAVENNLNKIIRASPDKIKQKIIQLLNMVEGIPKAPVDWEMILLQLDNLHPGFLERLQVKHPNLTPKEKKLCAFLRLNLSSKDISGLLNVQTKSVEIARVRLRKKLKLERKTPLISYINHI